MVKCFFCKKRSALSFKCKCEYEFCVKCRLPEVHKCKNKIIDKTELVKKLLKVEASKVEII
jgi:predicted nucleic acid binding AN1-type Zn finger protein